MMRTPANDDLPRDGEVAYALERHLALEGARSAAEIDLLRQSIVARAAFRLAGLRRAMPWWELASGWVRVAVPLGIAAGIVAVLVSTRGPLPDAQSDLPAAGSYAAGEVAFTADSLAWATVIARSPGRQVVDQFLGPVTRERLLSGAMWQ